MDKIIRIAKIINTTSVVINAGLDEDIAVGDEFQIIGKRGTEVFDPETKESLGTLDDLKATVIASTVYPHMTIAESKKRKINNPFTTASKLPASFSTLENDPFATRYVHDDLNVDKEQITGSFKKSDKPIQIGDIVVKIKKD